MHVRRSMPAFGLAIGVSMLSACGGGSLPATSPSSATLPSDTTITIPRDTTPQSAISFAVSTSVEHVIVLHNVCTSLGGDGNCSQGPVNEYASQWQLTTGAASSNTSLGGQGGAMELVVSADDRYVISNDQQNGVEVDGPNGSRSMLVTPATARVIDLVASTNLTSDLIVENSNSRYNIYGYREPYTTSYGHVSIPAVPGLNSDNGFAAASNTDGSQVFVAQRNGTTTQVSIGNLSTGAVQTTGFAETRGEVPMGIMFGLYGSNPGAAFDPIHQWFYFLSSPDGNAAHINRVQIFSTTNHAYLGYINLPVAGATYDGLVLDANTGQLYVYVNSHIYVYEISSCGCTKPLRVLTAPASASGYPAIDRTGTHLLLLGSDAANPYTPVVYDLNPKTGALQRKIVVGQGSASQPDYAAQVLAQ